MLKLRPAPMRSPRVLTAQVRQPLYANALYLWASTVVAALGGLAFWAVAARRYSVDEVGLASAALSAMTLLGSVSHLGLGNGLIRELPRAAARRTHLINLALTLAAVVSLLCAAVFLAGLRLWSPSLAYLHATPARALAYALFTVSSGATIVLLMTFAALRTTRQVLLTSLVVQSLRLALAPLLVGLGSFGLIAAAGLAGLVGVVAGFVLLSRIERPYRPRPEFSAAAAHRLVPFGLANHVADLAVMAPRLILPVMVVAVLGAADGARFYIGFFLASLLFQGLQSLATSLFAEGAYDVTHLEATARHALVWAVLLSSLGAAVMAVAGVRLLAIFGRAYATDAAGLVRLVALAAVPGSMTYVYLAMLRVRGRMPALIALAVAICAVSLGVSFVLLPRLGITAPAVGLLAGQGLGAVACLAHLVGSRDRAAPHTKLPPIEVALPLAAVDGAALALEPVEVEGGRPGDAAHVILHDAEE